ncbi:MAG: proline racemase family protein, partial [Acidobacteriota bacterium]|nr:proline racemase family protein [Acidobacteriota bacterium]
MYIFDFMKDGIINIVDSHTGGEPTRVVTGGFPDLGSGPMAARVDNFKTHYDHLRRGIVEEPRGHASIVGALLCAPEKSDSDAGLIFFNNAGYLGMCGHGTIGVVKTLEHIGGADAKTLRFDTVAGTVTATRNTGGSVTCRNVESYRLSKGVELELNDRRLIRGDIAWGGNWFFLVEADELEISLRNLGGLSRLATDIMYKLAEKNITGAEGARIDHIELFSKSDVADSRNFVLCPGGEYDRSPCGTGTSAKLACLAADGHLEAGDVWKQESV